MLELKLRDGVYYVAGTVNGRRIRQSTFTNDKRQANIERLRIESEAFARQSQCNVEEVVRAYCTRPKPPSRGVLCKAKAFVAEFGKRDPASLTAQEVTQWAMDGRQHGSANVYMGMARSALRYGERMGLCQLPPKFDHWPKPPASPPRDVFLPTVEEVDRFIACAPEWYRPMVATLFYAGLRFGEAASLQWDQVQAGYIHVSTIKGKGVMRHRRVPINAKLKALLDTIPHRHGVVFLTERGAPFGSYSVMHTHWNHVAAAYGQPEFNPHDARRTFATLLIRKGVNLMLIAEMLGHTDAHGRPHTNMLNRYAYLAPSQGGEAVKLLD